MGVLWVSQLRLLYLLILGITMVSVVMNVVYILTPQPRTTASQMLLPVTVEFQTRHENGTAQDNSAQKNGTSIPVRNNTTSSEIPSIAVSFTNSLHYDLTRAVPVKVIYESGHSLYNKNICKEKGKHLQLLIFITSAPSHDTARMAIRNTWGRFSARRGVSIVFMLGALNHTNFHDKIEKEHFLFQDIIQGKFIDTYDNLTLKSISMLEWVKDNCPEADYVLKTDDDMFINIPLLLTFISKHNPETRAIYGSLVKNGIPFRNKESKYYITHEQYKPEVFPDFALGHSYLLPVSLSKELYESSLNHTYCKLEDVFLTGIVANDLEIKRIHVFEFGDLIADSASCGVERCISIHVTGNEQFMELWKTLLYGN